jgi:hypothetical protein
MTKCKYIYFAILIFGLLSCTEGKDIEIKYDRSCSKGILVNIQKPENKILYCYNDTVNNLIRMHIHMGKYYYCDTVRQLIVDVVAPEYEFLSLNSNEIVFCTGMGETYRQTIKYYLDSSKIKKQIYELERMNSILSCDLIAYYGEIFPYYSNNHVIILNNQGQIVGFKPITIQDKTEIHFELVGDCVNVLSGEKYLDWIELN